MSKNNNLIRDKNLSILKRFLFEKKEALKSEMAKETGLSVVTVNSLTKQLIDENIFIEGEAIQQSLGRPATNYLFNYEYTYYLLLSIQEKKIMNKRQLVIVGKIVNLACEVKFEETLTFEVVTLANLISKIEYFLNLEYQLDKISLSFPGKIYEGTVISSWEHLFDEWKIAEAFSKVSDIPLLIHNDAYLLTVGYTMLHQLDRSETIVGIFYPEESMPGIGIYSKEQLIEGGRNLAGEAKYLPHLLDSSPPLTEDDYIKSLLDIVAIYNVVIAPNTFVISATPVNKDNFLKKIKDSPILNQQINQPNYLFVDHFQDSLTYGLYWLVLQNTTYQP